MNQIVEKENYNKLKTIERISSKAVGAPAGETNIREVIKDNVYSEDKVDRIYDRYLWSHTDKDGHTSYHYYIYTKIYKIF